MRTYKELLSFSTILKTLHDLVENNCILRVMDGDVAIINKANPHRESQTCGYINRVVLYKMINENLLNFDGFSWDNKEEYSCSRDGKEFFYKCVVLFTE